MEIRAAVFDMDGLMFDTERLGFLSWSRAAAELGLGGMEELYAKMIGANQAYCRELFLSAYGSEALFDEICQREPRYRRELIEKQGIPVKKGLRELLEFLRREHLPFAMATSSKQETAQYYLRLAGLTDWFSCIISGEQVAHSKPHPEIFQKACAALHTAPKHCVALEDSFNGIRSAASGGLIPVMVPDLKQPDDEMRQKAAVILPDLLAARDWIAAQNSAAESGDKI